MISALADGDFGLLLDLDFRSIFSSVEVWEVIEPFGF